MDVNNLIFSCAANRFEEIEDVYLCIRKEYKNNSDIENEIMFGIFKEMYDKHDLPIENQLIRRITIEKYLITSGNTRGLIYMINDKRAISVCYIEENLKYFVQSACLNPKIETLLILCNTYREKIKSFFLTEFCPLELCIFVGSDESFLYLVNQYHNDIKHLLKINGSVLFKTAIRWSKNEEISVYVKILSRYLKIKVDDIITAICNSKNEVIRYLIAKFTLQSKVKLNKSCIPINPGFDLDQDFLLSTNLFWSPIPKEIEKQRRENITKRAMLNRDIEIFVMLTLICDGYLSIKKGEKSKRIRFFNLASRLNLVLQTHLCKLIYFSPQEKDHYPCQHIEKQMKFEFCVWE